VTTIRLKYVHAFVDRHGRPRHYFRRHGKRVPLPGLPGSVEFQEAYGKALDGVPQHDAMLPVGACRAAPGTVDAMVTGYLGSAAFHKLAPASQQDYRYILDKLSRDHGDKRIAALERRHVVTMLNAKGKTPAAARNLLRCLRNVIRYAIDIGVRDDDPTSNIRLAGSKTGGYRTWSEDDIARFEAAYPIGSKQRLALALLLNTGLACCDVVRVGRGNIRDGMIVGIARQKTGVVPHIPITAELAEAINAAAPDHITFLINEHGRSFTASGLGEWFTRQTRNAGLERLTAHGLRKAAARRLAEAGCTAHELMAICGWKTLREAQRYTEAVDRDRMARSAVARLDRIGKPRIASGKPKRESPVKRALFSTPGRSCRSSRAAR
jgi:integrase